MATPHSNLLAEILLACPPNVRLFRNEVGFVTTDSGRKIRYGLTPGSADLIGYATIDGKAVFLSVEGKVGRDIVRPLQEQWHWNIKNAGGISITARNVEEFLSQISKYFPTPK